MKHDIAYYKKLQGALGSDSPKQTLMRQAAAEVNRCFQKTINWEVAEVNGQKIDLTITPGENEKHKKVKTRPGQTLRLGDIVHWANTAWLVNALDFNEELHCAAKMEQCNVVLRWQDNNLETQSEFGVAADATKYGSGTDTTAYLTLGSFVISVDVTVNERTMQLQRDQRFLIGYAGNGYRQTPFKITRINQITGTYDIAGQEIGKGYLQISMVEDQFREGKDNTELGIADYVDPDAPEPPKDESGWFG